MPTPPARCSFTHPLGPTLVASSLLLGCPSSEPEADADETDSGEPNGSTSNAEADTSADTSADTDTDADTDADTDTDTDTDTDAGTGDDADALPELQLCDPTSDPIWSTTTGGTGHDVFVAYACATPCDAIEACTEADGGWTQVHFVVDQMAGSMRWQLGGDLVFMHNGGTGTSYPDTGLIDLVLAAGHGVAMVVWQPGAHVDETDLGWATRPDEQPTDFRRLTARIASSIDWVETNLNDGAFGTAGCSAGSYVTVAAQLWHGLDDRLAYQLFVGGPPFADLGRGCGADLDPIGRCSSDPATACIDDGDCGSGPGSTCAAYHNSAEAPLADMVDSIHGTDPSCEQGQAEAAWDDSDFFTTDADWDLSHPVDFVMNMGPAVGDPQIGAFANAWDVAQVLSGDVGWHQQPGIHCGAFADDSTWPLLQAGMGW